MKNYRDTDYLKATARVRAMENQMVDAKGFAKMVDAKDAEEAFKVLSDAQIAGGYELADYEKAFENNLRETYDLVASVSPVPELVDIFRHKYDGHNLKAAIKARRANGDYSKIYSSLGNVEVSLLLKELDEKEFTTLHAELAKAGLEAQEQMAKTGDPQTVDIIIDRGIMGAMYSDATALGNSFLLAFVNALSDIANIRAMVRLKRMKKDVATLKSVLVPGGTISADKYLTAYPQGYDRMIELISLSDYGTALAPVLEELRAEKSLSLFEKLCDNYAITLLANVKFIPFGIEPLVAYLYGKECETKAARVVLASKLAGVSSTQITERLRDIYA